MNVNGLTLKGCHVPLIAFYRPVKAVYNTGACLKHEMAKWQNGKININININIKYKYTFI